MWMDVKAYALNWRVDTRSGYVLLWLEDDSAETIAVTSLEELAALGDILRNEKPVSYNKVDRHLNVGWELPGEEETNALP